MSGRRRIAVRNHAGHAGQAECPYLNGTGKRTCHRGCWEEPSCITDGPFRPTGVLWDVCWLAASSVDRWRKS